MSELEVLFARSRAQVDELISMQKHAQKQIDDLLCIIEKLQQENSNLKSQ